MTLFKEISDLLTSAQVDELTRIASTAKFVDGRISNPHSKVKQNLQLHDEAAYQKSSQILMQAMFGHEDFRNFAFPVAALPPLMTRYTPSMRYGAHADAAYLQLGNMSLRSDLSCTIFLNDPASYEGGALRIQLGTRDLRFRGAPGSAIVYPSDTMHEVEPVTQGERFVAITFIQSRIADPWRRELLYELNEIAALEGLRMAPENFTRMQLIQAKLLRHWGDRP
ncbi:Fe2+-dependent dioxygenase [Sphingosinicella terrae]|jgi:PKHD-type hydroxylase|uniref:Fe2+-dependent dioxygenase n=1 Tax=Sphingosinicella terrae TaxID=2172047 RepID=UPI000E0DA283|nr:Fe2+-dependent dioxygenase [Sphingosinicella terrae]